MKSLQIFAAFALCACGGQTVDYTSAPGSQNPTNPANDPSNPNRPNPPGIPTIAQGGDYTLLPQLLGPGGGPLIMTIVGSSPSDIWGTSGPWLYHWDGESWTQVPIGPPASTATLINDNSGGEGGSLVKYMASAGPGAVWIAHAWAVVRVDTFGNMQDHTSEVGPSGYGDVVSVDSSADMTVVTDSRNGAFFFDGTKFVALPQLPTQGPGTGQPYGVAVRSSNDIWVNYESQGGAHFDGQKWEYVNTSPVAHSPDPGPYVPYQARKMETYAFGGHGEWICPDWCLEDLYGQRGDGLPTDYPSSPSPWSGWLIDASNSSDAGFQTVPAPTDLDPSLGYFGEEQEAAKDGNLAFVGCAFPQMNAPVDFAGYYPGESNVFIRSEYVVHEWDGTTLHARTLTSAPECDLVVGGWPLGVGQSFASGLRPLTDGTWVLPASGQSPSSDPFDGALAVLMRP